MAVARQQDRQCGAPGAGAEDGDILIVGDAQAASRCAAGGLGFLRPRRPFLLVKRFKINRIDEQLRETAFLRQVVYDLAYKRQ